MKVLSGCLFVAGLVLTQLASWGAAAEGAGLRVVDLRCEHLVDPLGIDKAAPRFSWKVESDRNGTTQGGYQILVASERALLDEDRGDLWDSQRVESRECVLAPYRGKALGSGLAGYWKVRVWDGQGERSGWSPVGRFSIGLLQETDWRADYIGFPTEAGQRECPQVRRAFEIERLGAPLFLYVNSLGYHEVYLNGVKVGDGVLTPAVSQFTKRSQVVCYDISGQVKQGRNDLMIWLGSGWYTEGVPGVVHAGPLVRAQLERVAGGKREMLVATDKDWFGRVSGYQRRVNWQPPVKFGGERLDGRLARMDMNLGEAAGRSWRPVTVVSAPEHQATPQMVELNRISETIRPVEIKKIGDEMYLVDMGKCLSGWFEMTFGPLTKGHEITLEYCDHLESDGKWVNQNQCDSYIAAGEGVERFSNKFNYVAFRYVRISHLPEAPRAESMQASLIHTGYEAAAGFECSDPEMNRIHDMIFYTLRCLSLGGDLVDCPHIERLGYGGDGNASTETAQTLFDLAPLYVNWLQAWGDCQRDDGGMPHTAPNPWKAGGGPYWCGFIITASWRAYQHYGDRGVLERFYPAMQKWLGYAERYSPEGLLKRWPDTDYRTWYLGDWATPTGVDQKAQDSIDLVNNCFMVVCYDTMAKIAATLGKTAETDGYRQQADTLKELVHKTYYDPASKSYGTGTQIDLVYPMLAGVAPGELAAGVRDKLMADTQQKWNGHLACGLVGIPVLTEWAVTNGEADWMYGMLKQKGYPGYLHMLDSGATSTWEHWNGSRSRIHNCYNGIGSWFYQALGGIRPMADGAGYRRVLIQPQAAKGITWVKVFKETPYGRLGVDWEMEDAAMALSVEVPVGMEAEVAIPAGVGRYRLNGQDYEAGKDAKMIGVPSGKNRIEYRMQE